MVRSPPSPDPEFQIVSGGLRIRVRLTPRASQSRIEGVVSDSDGRPSLAVRIAAPPVDRAANKALIDLLAKQLGVGRSAVSISAGEASRHKTVDVSGDGEALAARLRALLSR